jgi:hypothetical protein
MAVSADDADLDEPLAGFRSDVDANQCGDLVPEGEYVVKAYFESWSVDKRWSPNVATFRGYRVPFAEAVVTAQIAGGEYAGWIVPTVISTLRWDPSKESSAVQLLRSIGVPIVKGRRVPDASLIRLLSDALTDEPNCIASVGWVAKVWNPQFKRSVVIHRTMRRFPPNGQGKHLPETTTPSGEVIRARSHVRSWKPLSG